VMAQAPKDAGTRLDRLLAVLSWLAQHGRVSLPELADQFGMTPEQLVNDLELAACCGLPPYTPDRLMEIIVDEQMVEAMLGPELGRPRRLSAQEGFALAAAARASIAARGGAGSRGDDGPLDRALAKLEAALGNLEVFGVDLGEPVHLASVRQALAEQAQLEIDYVSAWRDARSTRVVDPLMLSAHGGHWYLDAWCHSAAGKRRFRVDRIVGARRTGEEVPGDRYSVSGELGEDGVGVVGGAEPFVPGPEATLVRMVIPGDSAWLVETVPVIETKDLPGGRLEITLAVVSTVWLERLLLQLGPSAQVVEPEELGDLGKAAALRLLERYNTK
jgi:predicted DNA-binding transcriptional regulator YafY